MSVSRIDDRVGHLTYDTGSTCGTNTKGGMMWDKIVSLETPRTTLMELEPYQVFLGGQG